MDEDDPSNGINLNNLREGMIGKGKGELSKINLKSYKRVVSFYF